MSTLKPSKSFHELNIRCTKFIQWQRATSFLWCIRVTWIKENQPKRSVKLVSIVPAKPDRHQNQEWFKTEVKYKQKKLTFFAYSKDTPNQKLRLALNLFQQSFVNCQIFTTVNNTQNCVVKSSATEHGWWRRFVLNAMHRAYGSPLFSTEEILGKRLLSSKRGRHGETSACGKRDGPCLVSEAVCPTTPSEVGGEGTGTISSMGALRYLTHTPKH